MKWISAPVALCDCKIPIKFQRKFYKTVIRPTMLYGTKCWAVKKQHIHKLSAAEMRKLR